MLPRLPHMRQSVRVLTGQPAFSSAVVLVLGLSIGANSALFTVVNALLLRPLPFPHSEQLVDVSIPERRAQLEDFQRAQSIEFAGAFLPWNFAVAGPDGVRLAYGFRVTPDLIPLLDLRPALGRALTRGDFGRNVVMIGHEFWKALGARTDIAGQALTLDGRPYSIAGVLPADFFLEVRDVKLVVPSLPSGGRTIARLRPGSSCGGVFGQSSISRCHPSSVASGPLVHGIGAMRSASGAECASTPIAPIAYGPPLWA